MDTVKSADLRAAADLLGASLYTSYNSSTAFFRFTPAEYPAIRVEVRFTGLSLRNGQYYYTPGPDAPIFSPQADDGYSATSFTGKGSRNFAIRKAVRQQLADLLGLRTFVASWE